MLARIGIKINLNAQTRGTYFAKILGPGYNTSFYMLGWTPGATYDVHNVFEQLMQTRNAQRRKGTFNVGGWSNARSSTSWPTRSSRRPTRRSATR